MHQNALSSNDDLFAGLSAVQREAITDRHNALLSAIMQGKPRAVAAILAEPSPVPLVHLTHGTDNGTSGLTPLHQAAMVAHVEICRLLIKAGARLDAQATVFHRGPLTPLDGVRLIVNNPFVPAAKSKSVIRLLEREADRQGIDAETMQASVKRGRNGTVSLSVVNKHTGAILDYDRARLASDRAMTSPDVMEHILNLMPENRKRRFVLAEAGPALH
ncbi:ankyrin repeat domain-containing protein [Burkholderia cenocepacia]|uniref:ankyrin repeat domain-containing protein n=1 Tax=Burkholderia cenocepacia TaxID=95486 RepID=UPI002AB683D4|nr:ankyrin repeat domain-containing protein [Burkholderia cenocepacia]